VPAGYGHCTRKPFFQPELFENAGDLRKTQVVTELPAEVCCSDFRVQSPAP
jgi:hypothetical protein